jgi:hypothetical protein
MNNPEPLSISIDRRLRRSAAALGETGLEILAWLHQPEQRAALVKAAELGLPSVAGISSAFADKFGRDAIKAMVVRQFVGRAVKHIMDDEGYAPADPGVKLPGDKVFKTGTRYRRRSELTAVASEAPLLERFVAALRPNELHELEQLLRHALEQKP